MSLPYEDICGGNTPSDYGTIVDFRNETANINPHSLKGSPIPPKTLPASGGGHCGHDYGYQNAAGTSFLAGQGPYSVNYSNGPTLYYDAHPGYDYGFTFGTPLIAAVSGCVEYDIFLNYGKITLMPSHYHILTIVPVSSEPPEGCTKFVAQFKAGHVVNYLHLSSYVDAHGTVLRSTNPDGSSPTPCSMDQGCAQADKWVPAGSKIGFSGNYANGWGTVIRPHLHFEVDLLQSGTFTAVDPYGWHAPDPSVVDPYSIRHPNVHNTTLWSDFPQ
jgi:murein DD-endopeptidase MepM/ murein hydrolase activator NlpD